MMTLESLITSERFDRFCQTAARRTRFHTFVLDEVHKGHNISAILRSLDGFGFQDVYTINDRTTLMHKNPVAKGAQKWLSIYRYQDVTECIREIKTKGYRIAVTSSQGVSLTSMDWSTPTAVVMGAELDGIGSEMRQAADVEFTIPMVGLTHSFNVSVATACIAFHMRKCLETLPVKYWALSPTVQHQLVRQWISRDREIDESDVIKN